MMTVSIYSALTNEEIYNIEPWEKDEKECKLKIVEDDKVWNVYLDDSTKVLSLQKHCEKCSSLKIDLLKALHNQEILLKLESTCNRITNERFLNENKDSEIVRYHNDYVQFIIQKIGYIKHILLKKFNLNQEAIHLIRTAA